MRKLIVAVLALLLVGSAAIAWASIPGPDGVIHGCYKNNNPAQGAIIVVDHTASCPSGYTALNWNQTGPQGPAGDDGVSGYESVYAPAPALAHGAGQAQAFCPSGKVVTGGGFQLGSPPYNLNMHVRRAGPYYDGATYSWLVVVDNENDVDYSFAAEAICAYA
jgi:hypothetical protein